jgi:hypothetical protein
MTAVECKTGSNNAKLYRSDCVQMLGLEYKAYWKDRSQKLSVLGKERYARGDVKGLIPRVKGWNKNGVGTGTPLVGV